MLLTPVPKLLSLREEQVLNMASAGLTDRAIADHLGLSLPTVKSYWVRIRQKVGGQNRTQAVARHLQAPAAKPEGGDLPFAGWWRAMARHAPWIVLAMDADGTIRHLSRPPLRGGAEHMVGRRVSDLCPPGATAYLDLHLCRALSGHACEVRLALEVVPGRFMEFSGRLAPNEKDGVPDGLLFLVERTKAQPVRRKKPQATPV